MASPLPVLTAAVVLGALLAGCSSGGKDSDKDGLGDKIERQGWLVTVDLVGERVRRQVTSDPQLSDTDGDGLSDQIEFVKGIDPANRDTDGDGLTDCQEELDSRIEVCEDPTAQGPFDGGYRTIANNADSDAGPGRYVNEVLRYKDPSNTIGNTAITWGDGISDGDEVRGYTITLPDGGTRTVMTDPRRVDSDEDELEDGEEALLYHTDPLVFDTDADTCQDGFDPLPTVSQRYDFGLQAFLLTRAPGVTASANLQVQAVVADFVITAPDKAGYTVRQGERTDVSFLNPPPFPSPACDNTHSFPPWDPWIPVQVQAVDVDAAGPRGLDVSSHTNPNYSAGRVSTLWWKVDEDRFAWTKGGDLFEGGDALHWRGGNGELWFRPRIVE